MMFHADNFLVEGLELIEPAFGEFDGRMYAGLLPTRLVDEENNGNEAAGKLMFWLFESPHAIASDTLTIWLNGGPGCSSFQGALFENAPVTTPHFPAGYPKTTAHLPLVANEWAWTKATNMMFLEQPVGTGFSFMGQDETMPKTEADVSRDFYYFLVNFYKTFPEMQSKELYIFGESYAGMYVPAMAREIYLQNKQQQDGMMIINLQGIGLGNGWMDAKVQGPMVIDYAWWHGMIDSTTKDALHKVWEECGDAQHHHPMQPPFHDFAVPDECNIMGGVLAAAGAGVFPPESYRSPNTYDVTTFDLYPLLFNDNSTYYNFYNNPKVKTALHAPLEKEWLGCLPGAGRRRLADKLLPGQILLAHDRPISVVPYIAELLDDAGIRVLVYNGDRDMSVNAQGSEKLLDGMNWSGQTNWKKTTTSSANNNRALWMVDNQVAGYAKSYKGLDFVIVYNSGHLVPYNVPVAALDLIERFVTNQTYLDKTLPSFSSSKLFSQTAIHSSSLSSSSCQHEVVVGHVVILLIVMFVSFVAGSCWSNHYRNNRHKYSRIQDVPLKH